VYPLAIRYIHCGKVTIAQANGVCRDHVKHWLHVGQRPADDLQNLGGGGLLFLGDRLTLERLRLALEPLCLSL
jgi:hypothetical protein